MKLINDEIYNSENKNDTTTILQTCKAVTFGWICSQRSVAETEQLPTWKLLEGNVKIILTRVQLKRKNYTEIGVEMLIFINLKC